MATEVTLFLRSQGLEKYSGHMRDHEIDMARLLLLTDKDLTEMGLPKGPRLKLLAGCEALRMLESGGVSSDEESEQSLADMTDAERRAAHQAEMDSLFEEMRQEQQQQSIIDEAAQEEQAAAERAAAAERRAAAAAERAAAEAEKQRKAEEKKRRTAERKAKERAAAAAAREAAAAAKKVKDAARAAKAAEKAKRAAAKAASDEVRAAREAEERAVAEAAAEKQRQRTESWRRLKRNTKRWIKKNCPSSEICTVIIVLGLIFGCFFGLIITEELFGASGGMRLLDGSKGRLPQSEQIAHELERVYAHLQGSGGGRFDSQFDGGLGGAFISEDGLGMPDPEEMQQELELALGELTVEELRSMLVEHNIELPPDLGAGEGGHSKTELLEFILQSDKYGDALQTWKTWLDAYDAAYDAQIDEGCPADLPEVVADDDVHADRHYTAIKPTMDRAADFKEVGMDVLEALALATLEDIVAQTELVKQLDDAADVAADFVEEDADAKEGKDVDGDEAKAGGRGRKGEDSSEGLALPCTGVKPCPEFEQKWRKVLKPRWKRALDGIPDARMSISELKTVALSQSVRKFDAAFEYLDTNGDSHVSTDELFEVFGKKKANGRKKSGKRRREPSLHMPVHWMDSSLALGETLERLRLDFNGDGRIEYTEATQLYILLTFARQLDAAKQLLLTEAEAAAVDRQELAGELGEVGLMETIGEDGEPILTAMLAVPWDARPGDELRVPPPIEQFQEIGGYPADKDGYVFTVTAGMRGGDLARLPVATPEEAGQVVFQVEGYGQHEQVLAHRATGGDDVSGSGAPRRGSGAGEVQWTWTGRLPIGGGGGLGGAPIQADAFTYDAFNAYVPVEYHFACPANAAPVRTPKAVRNALALDVTECCAGRGGRVSAARRGQVDVVPPASGLRRQGPFLRPAAPRAPPLSQSPCTARCKTHGLGYCVQDELTAAFEYCALAAEVVTAQPTPFGALARL